MGLHFSDHPLHALHDLGKIEIGARIPEPEFLRPFDLVDKPGGANQRL